jgi:hypothetical protein
MATRIEMLNKKIVPVFVDFALQDWTAAPHRNYLDLLGCISGR